MVEKLKLLPKATGKEEEKKDDSQSKKVTMGKGYLSIESLAPEKKTVVLVFRNLIGKTLY